MPTYLNNKLVPDETPFRLIDLLHHHCLGDLYFAKLPRYTDVTYYGAWHENGWWYKTDSLAKLFRATRDYLNSLYNTSLQ